ncbi:MAG: PAS domain S-box protein [Caldilineaceae bacterium]
MLFIVTASVFAAEALLMFVILPRLDASPLWIGFLDSGLLTVFILPFLYFFLIRPLTQQIKARQRFEAALESANAELEQRVQARTKELTQANTTLRQEISERKRTEDALRQARMLLETRVKERTRDLAQANEDLKTEISERRRAEKELHVQTRALHAAGQGIVITDRSGCILWANPAFTDISGYTLEDVTGHTPRILNAGQHDAKFFQTLWETILSGTTWIGEITNRRKNGETFIAEQTITPVTDELGEVTHFITIMRDITERKRTQDQLFQKNQELLAVSRSEHEQRQFAEALFESTAALCSSLNLNEVLDRILEQLASVTPYVASAVFLLRDDWVEIPRHRRYDGSLHSHDLANGFRLSSVPQLRHMVAYPQPLLVDDTQATNDWHPLEGLEWIRSCIIVPMVEGDNVVGFLATVSDEANYFEKKSLKALAAFAAHATVAVKNAWLFEQVRTGHKRLQSLSHRLVETQEAERRYIAQELHDEAGQSLTSLLFGLRDLEKCVAQPERILPIAAELRCRTEEIMEGLHRLAVNLRPTSLDHLGLVAALEAYIRRLSSQSDWTIRFKAVGLDDSRLATNLETTFYRIAQEALTNVLRHADATRVDVLLQRHGDKVSLVIEDDGVGFDVQQVDQTSHVGLVGVRERCERFNGVVTIESSLGNGTTIIAEIPYADSYPIC